jgi:hypothetical protein
MPADGEQCQSRRAVSDGEAELARRSRWVYDAGGHCTLAICAREVRVICAHHL